MSESLFTNQTPSSPDQSDGTPGIGTATTMQFAAAGTVTGIRFYCTTTKGGTYTGELWQVTSFDGAPDGDKLASKAVAAAAVTAGTWNIITFDTGVSVATVTMYRAVLHNDQGRYVATPGFFSAAGLTNGNLTAYRDATDPTPPGLGTMRQGTFVINAAAGHYPDQGGNGTCYFVDVVFDETVTTIPATLDATGPAGTAEMSAEVNGLPGTGHPATASAPGTAGPHPDASIIGAVT